MSMLMLLWLMLQGAPIGSSEHVVFVCEHGAAKSLIAAAYFNKLAAERGIPARAIFRGTAPQDALSVRSVAGLKADGLPIPDQRPTAVRADEIATARYVFTIGCTLPTALAGAGHGNVGDWSDVPDDKGYEPMRDAIVRHVNELLNSMAAASTKR